MQRLDKVLSEAKVASRKELKSLIRSGVVEVNGRVVRSPEEKIPDDAEITVRGEVVDKMRTVLVMLYKPAGYITATEDRKQPTVMDLIPDEYRKFDLVPVGRLDKETEGLLLLTNDGDLAHKLISPKYAVQKVYYAEHEGEATQADIDAFAEGLVLGDGTKCLPGILEPIGPGKSYIHIREGKYHQVRRMMASRNMPVSYLRREQEGPLTLENLALGEMTEIRSDIFHFDGETD